MTDDSFRAVLELCVEEYVKPEYLHYFDEIPDSDQFGQMLSERGVVQFTARNLSIDWNETPARGKLPQAGKDPKRRQTDFFREDGESGCHAAPNL